MVLSAQVNKAIVSALKTLEISAVGISGKDGGLLTAESKDPAIGRVGSITKVDPKVLRTLMDADFLAQFLNKTGSFAIGTAGADAFSGATGQETTGEEIYVDGITGATVTSKAVARCVNSAVAYVTGADVASSATTWGG